jgi:hypothetical protein
MSSHPVRPPKQRVVTQDLTQILSRMTLDDASSSPSPPSKNTASETVEADQLPEHAVEDLLEKIESLESELSHLINRIYGMPDSEWC